MKTLSKVKPMKVEKVHEIVKKSNSKPIHFKISVIEASKSKPKSKK